MLPDGSPASRTRTAALSCVVLEPVMPWRQTVPPACRHSVLSLAAAASREVGATRSQPGTATSPPEHSRQPGPSRRNVGGLDPPTRLHRLRAVRPESSRPAPPGLPVFTLPSAAALLPRESSVSSTGRRGQHRPVPTADARNVRTGAPARDAYREPLVGRSHSGVLSSGCAGSLEHGSRTGYSDLSTSAERRSTKQPKHFARARYFRPEVFRDAHRGKGAGIRVNGGFLPISPPTTPPTG